MDPLPGAGVVDAAITGPWIHRIDLTFKAEHSRIYDEETGSVWNIAGVAYDGILKGKRLASISGTHCLWFGWWATYPNSVLYPASRTDRDNVH